MLSELRAHARFALGLPSFLRQSLTLEKARTVVRERLETREARFFEVLRRGLVGNRRNPYRMLLELADCGLTDIERMLDRDGLETTLEALRQAGVYVTFEELKGRRPILRHGREIPVAPGDFDNPHLKRWVRGSSSGSTGRPTRTAVDLSHLRATTPPVMLARAAHGTLGVPTCHWRAILPSTAGVNAILRSALMGNRGERWISPMTPGDLGPSLKDRLATAYILGAGRLGGVGLPRPEFVNLEHAEVVARWASDSAKHHGCCLVRGHVSTLLRVALAAAELELDLRGAILMGGGEPPTRAKVGPITATGARFVPTYFFAEIGPVAFGCANPSSHDDMHLLDDCVALVAAEQKAPEGGTVHMLHFTSLLPSAPKLLVNAASDDFGTVAGRSCGCPLEAAGYRLHIRGVRSVAKLTGEGMTLVGSDMLRVLEEVLPQRFGGSALDFQILEEEDGNGLTRIYLLVHPRLSIPDEAEVIHTVRDALAGSGRVGDLSQACWHGAGSLIVRREQPRWNRHGKFPPIITLGHTSAHGEKVTPC